MQIEAPRHGLLVVWIVTFLVQNIAEIQLITFYSLRNAPRAPRENVT